MTATDTPPATGTALTPRVLAWLDARIDGWRRAKRHPDRAAWLAYLGRLRTDWAWRLARASAEAHGGRGPRMGRA